MPGAVTKGVPIVNLRKHFEGLLIVGHEGGHWSVASKLNNKGYHVISIGNAEREYAHRTAYRLYVGEIPAGLDIDHLCRTTWCVNPAHLEPVTRSENLRRAYPACRRGHEFKALSSGRRWCPECQRIRRKENR